MSQENVEIVRRAFVATSGGEPEAAQAAFDPSIEWDMSGVPGWLEKRVYRGPDVGVFLRAWADSWQDWHFEVTDIRDAAEDRVFVAIHEWGVGADSQASVEQRRYFVVTVRDGLIARVRMFSESSEALEAAGLSEWAISQENATRLVEAYARFNAGERDPERLQIWHDNAEYHVAREDPDSTVHRGMDALKRHYASWIEAYPDLKVEPLETKENGDQVFSWVHFSGHGAGSGAPMEMELAHVVTFDGGKVTRLVEYMDKAEALEAAGLTQEVGGSSPPSSISGSPAFGGFRSRRGR